MDNRLGELHELIFRGRMGVTSKCGYEIAYRDTGGAVVTVHELADNTGTSIRNAFNIITKTIFEKHLADIHPNIIEWYVYTPPAHGWEESLEKIDYA